MTSDSILDFPEEQWLDVLNYENIYKVSNYGRVKRLAGTPRCVKERLLKQTIGTDGYFHVTLCKNSAPVNKLVHDLVTRAFLGERPIGYEVNHIDGIRLLNVVNNLEYVTRSQNGIHAYRVLGRVIVRNGGAKGEKNHNARLTSCQVIEIRKRYADGEKNGALAKEFDISPSRITRIVQRKQWKHLEE